MSDEPILSKSTFLCNALHGKATLSRFELAWGYALSFVGLPQSETSKELLESALRAASVEKSINANAAL